MKSRQKERGQGRMKRKPFVSGPFGSVSLVRVAACGWWFEDAGDECFYSLQQVV
jgi:hypothetical protein